MEKIKKLDFSGRDIYVADSTSVFIRDRNHRCLDYEYVRNY